MKDVNFTNFGFLIAYLLPGFTALWGLSFVSETVRSWLGSPPTNVPTIGGFLYVTIASVAAGLTVSTVRWAVLDTIHHWAGVPRPQWDFSRLQENVSAFDVLGENHYRYYQWYGNMAIAIPFWYAAKWAADGWWPPPLGWAALGVLALEVLFLAGSRDTAVKYYTRVARLLDSTADGPGRENKGRQQLGVPEAADEERHSAT